jgi:hypothetical protein
VGALAASAAAVQPRVMASSRAAPLRERQDESDHLAEEAALLDRARSEIRRDACRAVGLVNAHERTFPASRLAIEREVLRIDALSRCGRVAEAARRGRELLARSPGSLYEARIRDILHRPSP